MTVHQRSSFVYHGSDKGAEVGARNEAAFMNFEKFRPPLTNPATLAHNVNLTFAMPHTINLLTVSPLYCALVAVGCMAWGLVYWDVYCNKTYTTVLIERAEGL